MDKKIIDFKNTYYEDYEIKTMDKNLFIFVNKEDGRKNTYPYKILNPIKENASLKNIDNLFIIKVFNKFNVFYSCFFKYKNIKLKIKYLKGNGYYIEIYSDKEWVKLKPNLLEKAGISEKIEATVSEIEKIKDILINEIITNTSERINLLINKKGEINGK